MASIERLCHQISRAPLSQVTTDEKLFIYFSLPSRNAEAFRTRARDLEEANGAGFHLRRSCIMQEAAASAASTLT